jgi:hypothetical protein
VPIAVRLALEETENPRSMLTVRGLRDSAANHCRVGRPDGSEFADVRVAAAAADVVDLHRGAGLWPGGCAGEDLAGAGSVAVDGDPLDPARQAVR